MAGAHGGGGGVTAINYWRGWQGPYRNVSPEDQAAMTPAVETVDATWTGIEAGVMAGLFVFPSAVMPALVGNATGETVYVRVNSEVSPTDEDFDICIPTDSMFDISFGVRDSVRKVTVWVPTGGVVEGLSIRGL